MHRPFCLAAASIALGACQAASPPPPPVALAAPREGDDWRALAAAGDAARIDRLPAIWAEALAAARQAGFASGIAGEGPLLAPDAALPRAALPPGSYRCRILRFGGGRAFTAYPGFFCHVGVEGRLVSLTKQTGSERPGGYVWRESDERGIFLGAMALGEDSAPPPYGEDRERDLAGVVERVGPFRWRLVVPRSEGLDVLELVPVVPAAR